MPTDSKTRFEGWRLAIPFLLHLAALVLFLLPPANRTDFPLDDAWIHRVYSRSFAFGHGFAYNPGQQEAGSTSPLWSILTAPAHWLEPAFGVQAVVVGVKAMGVLLGFVIIGLVFRLVRILTGSAWAAVLAGSLLALDSRLLFSDLSGMEINLFVALVLAAGVALAEKRLIFGICLLGLAPTARPEGFLLFPLALAAAAEWGLIRASWKSAFKAMVVGLVPTFIWAVFCLYANGHLLPTTFYVKATRFNLGLPEIETALGILTFQGFASLIAFLPGLIVFLYHTFQFWNRANGWRMMLLVATPLAVAIGVAGTRNLLNEGYYWTRWLDPSALLLTAASAAGYGILVAGWEGCYSLFSMAPPRVNRMMIKMAGVVGLLLLLGSAVPWTRSFAERRDRLASDSHNIRQMNVSMGLWIKANTAPDAVVGVVDAGAIRYFGERRTLDWIGLNWSDVAFGRVTRPELMDRADWLVVFVGLISPQDRVKMEEKGFEVRHVIRIPFAEYTICKAREQTEMTAFGKRK